jgi:hypothetical protein
MTEAVASPFPISPTQSYPRNATIAWTKASSRISASTEARWLSKSWMVNAGFVTHTDILSYSPFVRLWETFYLGALYFCISPPALGHFPCTSVVHMQVTAANTAGGDLQQSLEPFPPSIAYASVLSFPGYGDTVFVLCPAGLIHLNQSRK